jgi:hypothetical protein
MTKILKMLGAVGLTAVLGIALFGATALADSPPAPPARFVGSVTVNGAPATAGTAITAVIGSTTCGTTSVFLSGAEARYTVDSPALDPGATPNCGTDGATVSFTVGGVKANETGVWHSYQLNTVNLTVTTATATVTPSASATPAKTATATPKGPTTGSGVDTSNSGTAIWLFVALGLGALAFGVGGVSYARKSNR